jgi:hypothetical protein
MKLFRLYILLLSCIIICGCKKHLAEEPTRQTSIKTAEQLETLVDNATFFAQDNVNWFLGNSTDHTELPSDWRIDNDIFHYTFNFDPIAANLNERTYSGMYRQIFNANVVLTYVGEVEGDAALKEDLKADAHFIRAYCYWFLANTYCLPYAQGKNEQEPGMTLKTTTEYQEPLQRATLKQTYDLILADLNEAMKTARDDVDPKKPWRVSKKAAAAFLSRVHLFLGNYDEALTHTNNALASTTAQLVDFRTIKAGNPGIYRSPADTLKYSELYDWRADKWLYWKEFYITRVSQITRPVPSPGLLSLYDQDNDLRFKWFMIPKHNRVSGSTIPYYGYVVFNNGAYVPTGPTVAEVLLNKAEILARKGDAAGAMDAVNMLRAKRMNTAAPLSATDTDDAIKKVLDERRREMPFSMRWFDIRRFSVNDYAADDVTVSRTYYKVTGNTVDRTATQPYTIPPGSRLWALPVPDLEISQSKDVIQQNQY